MNDAHLGVILAFIFGVVFVTALLALVIFIPNPTPSQFEVIRIVLALAAGGVAAMIPGFLNLKLGIGSNLALRAGGALAVFAIVYFYSPARWEVERFEHARIGVGVVHNGFALLIRADV